MTLQETIGNWAARFRLNDAPDRIVKAARGQMMSVLGASHAAALSIEGQSIIAAANKWPDGICPVIPSGRRCDRFSAIEGNAGLSATFDYDDYMLVGHGGHSAVHVSLALGLELDKTIGDVFTAQIAANEVAGRLGLSCFFGPQNGQQLPFIHQVAGAVAAGWLLGLSAEEMTHALGIALSQPPAPLLPAFLGSFGAKILVASQPSATGARAAELARAGMTAATDLLDHPTGFFSRFSYLPMRRVLSGFGKTWILDTLHIKTYPCCAYHLSTYALLEMFHRDFPSLDIRDILSVTIETTALSATVSGLADHRKGASIAPNEANFSLTTGSAVALLAKRFTPDDLTSQGLKAHEKDIRNMASRIRVVHDVNMTADMIAAVHEALHIPSALGNVKWSEIIGALIKAKKAFPDVPLAMPTGIGPFLARVPGIYHELMQSRRAGYDLGDHCLEGLAFPFSSRVTIALSEGRKWSHELRTPPGALADDRFLSLAREKFLSQASRHVPEHLIHHAADIILGYPLDTPVSQLIDCTTPPASKSRFVSP